MSALGWLMEWYKSYCDGSWEHNFRVEIKATCNPGWCIAIGLEDTPLEYKTLDMIKVDNGDNDWYLCWAKDKEFQAAGDTDKLEKIIELFKA